MIWPHLVFLLSTVSVTFTLISSNELPLLKTLNSECKTNNDCITSNAECSENHCTCRKGFVEDGTLTKCLKVANSYNDECEESVQCSRFLGPGGSCESSVCVCLDGYHYLHGFCHLSKGLNDPCQKDEDCFVNAEYQAVKCKDSVCICNDEYYQREYSTCRPAQQLGEHCILDSDCKFHENVICLSHKCTKINETNYSLLNDKANSNNNNYENELSDSLVIGNDCNEEKDCAGIPNSECGIDKKCKCKRAYFPSAGRNSCIPEIGESCKSSDKHEFSICKKGMWTCQYDMVNAKDNQHCETIVENIGGECKHREQCYLFGPRADCVNGECRCDSASAHWLERERFCWLSKKIGDTCASDNDCRPRGTSPQSVCKRKPGDKNEQEVCSCPDGTHLNADRELCLKDEPELKSYCEGDADCEVPNSSCINNECNCKVNYLESEGKCRGGLHAACKVDKDCYLNNTICFNKTNCQCRKDFVVSPTNECVHTSKYQEECKYDTQCSSAVSNTYCSFNTSSTQNFAEEKHGNCECISGYYYRENSCFKKKYLGEKCTAKSECFAEFSKSICKNGICMCEENYKKVGKQCRPVNGAPPSIIMQPWILASIIVSLKALR